MKSFTKSYQPIINTHTRTYAHGEERSPVAAAATAESHDGWEGKKKNSDRYEVKNSQRYLKTQTLKERLSALSLIVFFF